MEKQSKSRMSPKCQVETRKGLMTTYVLMYIVAILIMMVSFIMNMVDGKYVLTSNIIFLVGVSLVLVATVIWGFDRRCAAEK